MRSRFFFSTIALVSIIGILGLSLMSVQAFSGAAGGLTTRRMYKGEILPDHVAYPALMLMDRMALESAGETERIYLQIAYANRRLYYSRELLASNSLEKQALALTTLTKAQKYVLQAGADYLAAEEQDEAVGRYLVRALEYHLKAGEKLAHEFPDFDRPVLDQLRAEQEEMLAQFKKQLG